MSRRSLFATLIGSAVLALYATDASAYVRSRTGNGTPVKFDSACVFLQADTKGSVDVPFATVTGMIDKCFSNWNGIASCSYLQLKSDAPEALHARYDGTNVLEFLSTTWCHPADKHSPENCYDSAAAAITTVFYLDRPGQKFDGTIIDADIEMNEVNFTFVELPSAMPARAGTAKADLENTLTHEIGHLMGLDHTCADSATPANAVDENGARPPNCDELGSVSAAVRAKIEEATMYNRADQGETKKRTPTDDDVAGICAAYPASAKAPTRCEPVDLSRYTDGCQVAGATPSTGNAATERGVFFLLLVGGALVVLRRGKALRR